MNLAVLALSIALLLCAVGLFINPTAGLALEAIKIIGAGLVGYIGGHNTVQK
jgi:hypothetical protein